MIIFCALGIVASTFQLVALRELNFSIARQELIFILAAGFWVIWAGIGSLIRLPRKFCPAWLAPVLCFFFSAGLYLAHCAKQLSGLSYYQTPPFLFSCLISLAQIAPTALVIGMIFGGLSAKHSRQDSSIKTLAAFFAWEAAGFFAGGILFTFLGKDYYNPFIFCLFTLLLVPEIKKPGAKVACALSIILISAFSFFSYPTVLHKEFGNSSILLNRGSGYGPLVEAKNGASVSLFCAGSLLATNQDEAASEEFIHTSMAALPKIKNPRLLFAGAAFPSIIREAAKYEFASLDCVQINPQLNRLIRAQPLPEKLKNRINFIAQDPRRYLADTKNKYDAVLMQIPAGASLGQNRYFTEEFFRLVRKRLNPWGIFSFSLPSKREILSPSFARYNSSIINALDKSFSQKLLIPADAMILIASRTSISAPTLLDNFSAADLNNRFFTIHHLADRLDPQMLAYIQSRLDKNIAANRDLQPWGFLYYILLEQSKFYPNFLPQPGALRPGIILALLVSLCVTFFLRKEAKIFQLINASCLGFISISTAWLILVLFQIFSGALFWKLGLLTGIFMAAAALGSFFSAKIQPAKLKISYIYLFWSLLQISLYITLKIGWANEPILFLFSFLCGALTGSAYPVLGSNLVDCKLKINLACGIYAADLVGAFAGTIASGLFLMPFWGIDASLLILFCWGVLFFLLNSRFRRS